MCFANVCSETVVCLFLFFFNAVVQRAEGCIVLYLKNNCISQYHTDFLLCILLERRLKFDFDFYIYIIFLVHGCASVSVPLNQ